MVQGFECLSWNLTSLLGLADSPPTRPSIVSLRPLTPQSPNLKAQLGPEHKLSFCLEKEQPQHYICMIIYPIGSFCQQCRSTGQCVNAGAVHAGGNAIPHLAEAAPRRDLAIAAALSTTHQDWNSYSIALELPCVLCVFGCEWKFSCFLGLGLFGNFRRLVVFPVVFRTISASQKLGQNQRKAWR